MVLDQTCFIDPKLKIEQIQMGIMRARETRNTKQITSLQLSPLVQEKVKNALVRMSTQLPHPLQVAIQCIIILLLRNRRQV